MAAAAGLTDFVLFVTILNILLSAFLVTIPVVYDKYDKAIRVARALREDRVQFILTGTGLATVPLVACVLVLYLRACVVSNSYVCAFLQPHYCHFW